MIYLLIFGWLACGVVSAGIGVADWRGRYPDHAASGYRSTLGGELLMGFIFGLLGLVLNFFLSGFCEHGWTLRRPK